MSSLLSTQIGKRTIGDYATLGVSSAAGITLPELFAEYVAGISKTQNWQKFGVKAITKGIIAAIGFGLGSRVSDAKWKDAIQVAAISDLGTIVIDALNAAIPGGIPGLVASALAPRKVGPEALGMRGSSGPFQFKLGGGGMSGIKVAGMGAIRGVRGSPAAIDGKGFL